MIKKKVHWVTSVWGLGDGMAAVIPPSKRKHFQWLDLLNEAITHLENGDIENAKTILRRLQGGIYPKRQG